MNLDDAYSMMDLLLDEADLPYFSNEEKHKFLGLSISDFINMHYERMTSDEDSRRALAGCIDFQSFRLAQWGTVVGQSIIDGTYANVSTGYPTLDKVYPETYGTHTYGFFRHASQYVLPKNHLYVLQMAVKYYNKEDIIDPTTSLVYPGITLDDIVFTDRISVQNKSTRDYYEDSYSKDPFNNADMENPHWSYIENRIVIGGGASSIFEVSFQTITLPTVEEAFKESIKNETTNVYTYGARSFQLHHKTQIIQAAVGKMSQHIDLHN
tara:strand:+ start:1013 stop:1813 length:801 start_codon:yes stop_codon:yes gene_type:complete